MEPTPSADQTASSGLRKAETETELATNPRGEESLEKPTQSYTDMASNAASSAATQASAIATSTKDNVFSMFGGGPKKEKKEEPEAVDEPSGSSKAKKAEAAAEEDDVSLPARTIPSALVELPACSHSRYIYTPTTDNTCRPTQSAKSMSISSPLYA